MSLLAHPSATLPKTEAFPVPWRRPTAPLVRDQEPAPLRYRGLELIGEGGMGKVYRAWDPVLRRTVALKRLFGAGCDCREEARLQSRVGSPWAPTVFEVATDSQPPFFAMELIDGPTLRQARPRLELATKVSLGRELCRAVDACHRSGVLHCDLNPSNVVIRPCGTPCLIDFGVAIDRAARRPHHVAGTAPFMAPEQARGDFLAIDERTDVYGLGATLYQLFSGRQPFRGETAEAIRDRAVHQPPPPLASFAPELPKSLCQIVERCLAKAPEERFQSAAQIAGALDDASIAA
ncbi:MAG: serine/threonine-protein kinase [Acidobacteriota bacterium]